MPRLTAEQVGAVWILSGGPRDATDDAISQAYVESAFDTDAISSVGATGIWQIHPGGAQYKNPFVNGKAAVSKFRDGGNSFVKHWSNWQGPGTEAKRLAYLPRAKAAASRIVRLKESQLRGIVSGVEVPAGFSLPFDPPSLNPLDPFGLGPGGPDSALPEIGIGELTEFVGNIAEIFRGFYETFSEFSRKLTEAETWKDAGKIILGLILITIGIRRLFQITT